MKELVWEYLRISQDNSNCDCEYELNELGRKQWEMCGVVSDHMGSLTFYFKRQCERYPYNSEDE